MEKLIQGEFLMLMLLFFVLSLHSFSPVFGVEIEEKTDFDFSAKEYQRFYTKLDGEWLFFEDELFTSKEARRGKVVHLLSSFETQVGTKNTYGTYITTIKIPDHFIGKALAIYMPYQYSAYTLYVDQVAIMENGAVGTDSSTHRSEMAPKIGYFFAASNEIELVIQSSSFAHIRGGLENSIYFGEATTVTRNFNNKMHLDFFVTSGLFIMGIFTLSFVSFRKSELTFLVFGSFCIVIASRVLFADPFYYTLFFPNISWV